MVVWVVTPCFVAVGYRRFGGTCCLLLQSDVDNVLVGKSEGRHYFGRPKHRWEDDIKIDLEGTACKVVEFIHLAQNWVQSRAV
jgi:hypothetical protein